ncbi:MAG: YgiT-type zinc finger protein [Planctomycetota bacterium]
MYDFDCEHCGGKVAEHLMDREAFRHKGTFVILERVPIGICGKCGARYFDASVLRRVAEVGRGLRSCERKEDIAVVGY